MTLSPCYASSPERYSMCRKRGNRFADFAEPASGEGRYEADGPKQTHAAAANAILARRWIERQLLVP